MENFPIIFQGAPQSDLNIFGVSPDTDMAHYARLTEKFNTTCLFIMDSGHENVFA